MNLVGDPAAINAMAALLDAKADQLTAAGRRVAAQADSSSWTCAKADRFRNDMNGRSSRAAGLAQQLHDLAAQLRRLAVQVQQELDLLHSLELKVESVIAFFEHHPALEPPWLLSRWKPWNLPGPGDPTWRSVARAFGI
jgi:uncharacterized protein YukE